MLSPQQVTTHSSPAPQSALLVHGLRHSGMKQAQPPSVGWAHRQPAPGGPHSLLQGSDRQSQVGDWAKAGRAMKLVMTGAVQATAAPAPMRFSIRRRLILSSDILHLPWPTVASVYALPTRDHP